ncbi:hypothetical protein ACSP97_33800 [Streptomyces sp. SCPE 10]|uniref:hypothetical protein n=1 Tax=Streptomyces sp. SCPE 10 TaxID=3449273 RepID=UPI003F7DD575
MLDAETIDWHHLRMVWIAPSFSHHDRVAVQRLPRRIDVMRYRVFEGDRLSLLLAKTPHPPRRTPLRPGRPS